MEKKRIVVKIGSSSLTNAKGELDYFKFHEHIGAIARLKQQGHDVLLVSSGAVAAGFRKLGYSSRPVTLKGKQAAAAVGQSVLIQAYMSAFEQFGMIAAQVLLTRSDFSKKERYKNAYATFSELLDRSVIPIINENDTVSISELTFGDNDMLSALVSGLVHADQLIILTDINGLYDANPAKNPQAKRLVHIHEITDEMLGFADGAGSKVGTGGMQSKLLAARTALNFGVKTFIGTGYDTYKLLHILNGDGDGTYVEHDALKVVNTSKQWISLAEASGKLFVDEGAMEALCAQGRSLLAIGVCAIDGSFEKGDVIEVYYNKQLLGRGETSFSSDDIRNMIGKRSDKPILHRDQWVQF